MSPTSLPPSPLLLTPPRDRTGQGDGHGDDDEDDEDEDEGGGEHSKRQSSVQRRGGGFPESAAWILKLYWLDTRVRSFDFACYCHFAYSVGVEAWRGV